MSFLEHARRLVSTWARACAVRWAIVLPIVALVWIFPYLPDLRSPNELCRLAQTRSLVDHHTIEISEVLHDYGYVGDLSCVSVKRVGGAVVDRKACPDVRGKPGAAAYQEYFYPSKAPLLSFAATPIYYALERWRGGPQAVPEIALLFFARLFCTILPTAVMLVFLRRYLRARADLATADALTATYALGTLAFSYSEQFLSHQTTSVLLFATFYSLWRIGRRDWSDDLYVVAGLLAGLAVAAEYTGALALPALALYGVSTAKRKVRAALLSAAGIAPVVILLMWYHATAFGNPFHSGYKYLNDAAYQHWHLGGFLGIRYPDPRAFTLSFFSPLRGMFALSPVLLCGVIGLFYGRWTATPLAWLPASTKHERRLSALLFVSYAYFTSSFTYDSWGWTTGPRHLTPLVPFLLLPIAELLARLRAGNVAMRASTGLIAGLAATSVLITSAMTLVNYIPDELVDGLTGLALPLEKTGHFPHSLASFAGVRNPLAIAPELLVVALVALLVAVSLMRREMDRTVSAIALPLALAMPVAMLLLHASVKPKDDAERAHVTQTAAFLEARYVPRPKESSTPLFPPKVPPRR